MPIVVETRPNTYKDSVSLMQLSSTLAGQPGISRAAVVMGTPQNLDILREGDLYTPELAGVRPNDLVVAIATEDDEAGRQAIAFALDALTAPSAVAEGGAVGRPTPRSLLEAAPAANLALISVPGQYAAAEALKALKAGLHVHLFSDNVPVEDEISLKRFAAERGLLVMGPDAGTAIVSGVPLAFANATRRGRVGVVAASGTGAQQVTSLIHRLGSGISQTFGTGSHDLSVAVEGLMTSLSLRELLADPATSVVVLVSKPPAAAVAERLLDEARGAEKPVVVCFLGADPALIQARGLVAAETLEMAAVAAASLDQGRQAELPAAEANPLPPLAAGQQYVRGLYSGGTFCYEALLLLREFVGKVHSNIPLDKRLKLANVRESVGHTCIDFGEDEFTVGRPHPMIDFRFRNERLVQEARDPETAVILLDLVLGYGSHPDPAGALLPALREAQRIAADHGRMLPIIASVCGTDLDPQNLDRQESQLRSAGVTVLPSNAQAARFAGRIVASAARRNA